MISHAEWKREGFHLEAILRLFADSGVSPLGFLHISAKALKDIIKMMGQLFERANRAQSLPTPSIPYFLSHASIKQFIYLADSPTGIWITYTECNRLIDLIQSIKHIQINLKIIIN